MKLYSNEIVFRGHPDKVCDQISDALLDEYLKGDKHSRCGIEVCGGKHAIYITGEVTSKSRVDVNKVVRRVLRSVGYHKSYYIINDLGLQSRDIALGTNDEVMGAGDQGQKNHPLPAGAHRGAHRGRIPFLQYPACVS